MARVITFSTQFPTTHPKKGEPTYFVEQIYNSIGIDFTNRKWIGLLNDINSKDNDHLERLAGFVFGRINYKMSNQKHHTIRKGYRWKVGDKFSPRVWSGKPYASKQIIIAPDIEIKKIWDFSRDLISDKYYLNGHEIDAGNLELIAKNDGLSVEDFKAWINKPFLGQILCWNESINY